MNWLATDWRFASRPIVARLNGVSLAGPLLRNYKLDYLRIEHRQRSESVGYNFVAQASLVNEYV